MGVTMSYVVRGVAPGVLALEKEVRFRGALGGLLHG